MPVEEETFRESHEQAHSHLTSLSTTRLGLVVDLNATHASLVQDHHEFLSQIADGLLNLKDPEEVLARGFEALGKVNLERHSFHGDWNYTIHPGRVRTK